MNKKHIFTILFCLMQCACSSKNPNQGNIDNANSALAEASYSVSRSLVSLSETAQAAHPAPNIAPSPSPASYGMSGLTSIDWSGPVEPLICQLAKAANYRVRVLGKAPAIPVLVSIYDRNRMLADVLRDVGFQCGRRAAIVVYPDSRVIELRYAKN